MFVARTFATTIDPQGRLNGASRNTETGIEHFFAYNISVFDPSQFARSDEKL